MTGPTIYFVRHGQSEANARGVFAGVRDDSPLTEKGRAQAKAAAEDIRAKGLTINHVLVSPLHRARDTAEIIATSIGFDPSQIRVEDRLREYDMGLLSGHPIHPISSAELTQHPEAEDPQAFRRRLLELIAEVKQLNGIVLLVGHDGVERMLLAIHQGIDPLHFYDVLGLDNAKVTELNL